MSCRCHGTFGVLLSELGPARLPLTTKPISILLAVGKGSSLVHFFPTSLPAAKALVFVQAFFAEAYRPATDTLKVSGYYSFPTTEPTLWVLLLVVPREIMPG